MSGQGLISVRIPRSLLDVFRTAASCSKRILHGAARFLILGLKGLTPDQLSAIPEPPQEVDSPRVSLYVGSRCVAALTEVSQKTQLSVSSIVRRLAYGLFVDRSIWFVQNSTNKEWLLFSVQNGSEIRSSNRKGETVHAAS
jgi:hypothetical protein